MPSPRSCAPGRDLRIPSEPAGQHDERPSRPLSLLVLVPLLLAALAAGIWSFPLRRERASAGADIDDLTLIPADAQEFFSVRVADLWKTPAQQQAVALARKRDRKLGDPVARMEKDHGLTPQEIER